MTPSERAASSEMLELEERLTRYWLDSPLAAAKRVELERHLRELLDRRFTTNA